MENPDLRLKYGMAGHQTGMLLNKVYPHSPARGLLRSGDIILSIDGQNVADDGTIEFRPGERSFFGYLVQNKYSDEEVVLGIFREKRPMDVKIQLTTPWISGSWCPMSDTISRPPIMYRRPGIRAVNLELLKDLEEVVSECPEQPVQLLLSWGTDGGSKGYRGPGEGPGR
jgi:hypothetical protein